MPKRPGICSSLIGVEEEAAAAPPDSNSVSAIRNEMMVADNVIAPLISIDLELLLLSSPSLSFIPISSTLALVLLIPFAPLSFSSFLCTN
jgi:hypothetical protein